MAADYKHQQDGGVLHVPTGRSIPADPQNRDYRAYQDWVLAGGVAEPAEPAETLADLWAALRRERDTRLAETDQYGLVDYRNLHDAATVTAWDTYRQALRDLPGNTTDPRYVTWPIRPS